jgi:hypothetical protein
MGRLGRKTCVALFAALVCLLSFAPFEQAEAKSINYSVIAPHEFALPVNFDEGINIFAQYFWLNNDRDAWDIADSNSDTLTSVSKYVRFFNFEALPDVAFLWEAAIPAVGVTNDEDGITGFGDPQFGILGYVYPLPKDGSMGTLCIGGEWWFHIPFGDDELSNHAYDNDLTLVWDYQLGKFNFDGSAGILFKGDRRKSGQNWDRGEGLHANLRFSYAFRKNIEPFFALDWATDSGIEDKDTGLDIAASSDEIAVGGGLHFVFTPNFIGDVWYMKGVDGRNAIKTDAIYLKFVAIW